MKQVIKSLSIMTVGSFVVIAINLFTIPIYFNNFSRTDFGLIIIFQTVVLIVQVLANPFSWQSVIFVLNKNSHKNIRKINYVVCQLYELITTLIVLMICALLYNIFGSLVGEQVSKSIYLFFTLSTLLMSHNSSIAYLRSNEKFGLIVFMDIVRSVIRCSTAIVCVFQNDISLFYIGFFTSNAVAFIGLMVVAPISSKMTIRHYSLALNTSVSAKAIKQFKNYRSRFLYIWLKNILDILFNQFDKIVIAWCIGISELTIYEVAKRLMQGFGAIINNLNYYYYPRLLQEWQNGVNILRKSTFTGIFVTAVLLVVLIPAYIKIDLIYSFVVVVLPLEMIDWLFIFLLLSVFLLFSSFILVHSSFQISGYYKSDLNILILGNLLFFSVLILNSDTLGLWACLNAFLVQNFTILVLKIMLVRKKLAA